MVTPYYQDDHVTLYHGDCLTEHREWLNADVLVTDPPYGRSWRQGDTAVARGWEANERNGIAGDDSSRTRDDALILWGTKPGIVFGDLLIPAPSNTKQVLVWAKGPNAGYMGTFAGFRRDLEGVYIVGSWRGGVDGETSVLASRGVSGGNLARTTGHPHTKPADVMERLIGKCPPGIVADPFAGSGSTLVAAKALGRRAIGVELEERYCEMAAKRLAQDLLELEWTA